MDKIDHIVVVMMENRSFDTLLGKLYPKSAFFDGLSGDEHEVFNGKKYYVWNDPEGGIHPEKGPDNGLDAATEQLLGKGYCASYSKIDPENPGDIMHYYTPEQAPVLSYLAKQYAVSDTWFSSAPCSTQPNRFFVHTGSSGGDITNESRPDTTPSIFSRFTDWRVYFSDFPLTILHTDTWKHLAKFDKIEKFKIAAETGTLPGYSFIEPNYYWNDQHPPSDIRPGEAFLADIYNTLRVSPKWETTLLIITYDENGGIYDHVTPPAAIPPGPSKKGATFNFDRYGARIPTIIVSPYVAPGTIFRTPANSQPFDHTSILKSLRMKFKLGKPFSAREEYAPDIWSLLTLDKPTNLGKAITALPLPPIDIQRIPEKSGIFDLIDGIKHTLPDFIKKILLR